MTAVQRTARILLVDDSPDTLEVLERNLAKHGFTVMTALDAREAMAILERSSVDLLITDVRMPGMNGLELLRHVRETFPDTQVMLITGYATIEGAVEAMKTGAEEYLSKPFTTEELLAAVGRVLEKLRTIRSRRAGRSPDHWGLVGSSEVMRLLFDAADRAAPSHTPLLMLGEDGTGRESLARALCNAGPRADQPFLVLNGETTPPDTQGREIEHGLTFTQGGTLFLRAIECWSPELVEGVAKRAADTAPGCRFMVCAGSQFRFLVERGALPGQMGPLLSWETLRLPPLRERGMDVLLLAESFARSIATNCGLRVPGMTPLFRQALLAYPWPGNVRELRSAISAAVRDGASDPLDLPDLPSTIRSWSPSGAPATRPLGEVEAEYIRVVLSSVQGNKSRAAEILGIDRKTLREKLKSDTS